MNIYIFQLEQDAGVWAKIEVFALSRESALRYLDKFGIYRDAAFVGEIIK